MFKAASCSLFYLISSKHYFIFAVQNTDMNYHTEIGKEIDKAVYFLEQNECVAIPTETVYGLAANALEEKAIRKVFEVKKRPLFNPLIVHLKSVDEIEKYAFDIPQTAFDLFEKFSPGPLTIILPKKENISDLITAGKTDVALRIPNHSLSLDLLNQLNFPLAAPSANPFGYISPSTAEHVYKQLKNKIPYILDGGPCNCGIESTVIGFQDNEAVILRLGALSIDVIREVVPDIQVQTNENSTPLSPGMLKQHYSPNTRMLLVDDLAKTIETYKDKNIGIISFRDFYENIKANQQVVLSKSGNLGEAAQKLYAAFHYLDGLELDLILAEMMPEEGLGLAINDRLLRAAAKFNS
jgi:L-threonylcarbamoyladenylate synthase